MKSINTILLLGLACFTTNIWTVTGDCIDVKGQQGFEYPKFAVEWTIGYLTKEAAEELTNWDLKYGMFDQTIKSGQLEICTTEVTSAKKGQRLDVDSTVTYDEQNAEISLVVPNGPLDKFNGKYTIVSTDYDCYAIVVGCAPALNYPVLIMQFRDEVPSKDCTDTAKKAFADAGLNFDDVQADPDVIKE